MRPTLRSRAAAAPAPVESRWSSTSGRAALLASWLLSLSIAFFSGHLARDCLSPKPFSEGVHRSALDEAKAAVHRVLVAPSVAPAAARVKLVPGFADAPQVVSPRPSRLPKGKAIRAAPASRSGTRVAPASASASASSSVSASGSISISVSPTPPPQPPAKIPNALRQKRDPARPPAPQARPNKPQSRPPSRSSSASPSSSPEAAAVAVGAQVDYGRATYGEFDRCIDQFAAKPYRWATYIPTDPVLEAARERMRQPTDEELKDTAFVTMATGDAAARGATVLMQSLIDVGTRVPNLVILLFRGGHGSRWCDNYDRKLARRGDMYWPCSRTDATAEEVASPEFLRAWERMGVKYQVIDPIPDTNWTTIPGGRASWWGMSFNKLRVFHMTQYRKLVWMDSDTQVYQNIDHLMLTPTFTASYMQECMNGNSAGKTAGSTWVVEPSWNEFRRIERLYSGPVPRSDPPTGWVFTDMQVAAHAFGDPREEKRGETALPWTYDASVAVLPGYREFIPEFRAMNDEEWRDYVIRHVPPFQQPRVDELKGALPPEGLWPEALQQAEAKKRPIWRPLDVRYEAIAGNCLEFGQQRDIGPDFFSVHFTCMPVTDNANMHKPNDYKSEHDLINSIMTRAPRCLRYYMLRWYETYVRGMGARYPPPYYNGTLEVAVDSPAADAYRDDLIAGRIPQ